jgi:pimeloyl-ACP methyl ester carboxylesterase
MTTREVQMTRSYSFLLAAICFALLVTCSPAVEEEAPAEPKAQSEPVSELRDGFFDSGGVRIHFVEQGQGEPVVLLHGALGNTNTWTGLGTFKSLVDEGYRVIAFDCRGRGQSDKPHATEMYGLEMVEDVVRLLDHLAIDRAHIVGGSSGGRITNKLRAIHPERMLTAVLVSAGWMREKGPWQVDWQELGDAFEEGKGPDMMLKARIPEGQPEPSEEYIEEYRERKLAGQDVKALAAMFRSYEDIAVSESELRQNNVPTLVVIGEKDPLIESVDAMKDLVNNLETIVIEGADHGSTPLSPIFLDSLIQFLEKHRQTPKRTT